MHRYINKNKEIWGCWIYDRTTIENRLNKITSIYKDKCFYETVKIYKSWGIIEQNLYW